MKKIKFFFAIIILTKIPNLIYGYESSGAYSETKISKSSDMNGHIKATVQANKVRVLSSELPVTIKLLPIEIMSEIVYKKPGNKNIHILFESSHDKILLLNNKIINYSNKEGEVFSPPVLAEENKIQYAVKQSAKPQIVSIMTTHYLNIPKDAPIGTHDLKISQSFERGGVKNDFLIPIEIISVPKVSTQNTDINFGQLDVTSKENKIAYGGPISITNIGNTLSFRANYSSEINLTNTTDQTTVPMNIELLKDSKGGTVLDENFKISKDTDIYLKTTLPGTSIHNQPIGTYTGSITINLSVN